MTIKLDTIEKLKAFHTLVYKVPWRVNILLKQDCFCIDARKTLGVMSLNLERDITLIFEGLEENSEIEEYFEVFCEE